MKDGSYIKSAQIYVLSIKGGRIYRVPLSFSRWLSWRVPDGSDGRLLAAAPLQPRRKEERAAGQQVRRSVRLVHNRVAKQTNVARFPSQNSSF